MWSITLAGYRRQVGDLVQKSLETLSFRFYIHVFFFHSGRTDHVHQLFASKFNICILIHSTSDLNINNACKLGYIQPVVTQKDFPYSTSVVTFADGNFDIVSVCIAHNIKHIIFFSSYFQGERFVPLRCFAYNADSI